MIAESPLTGRVARRAAQVRPTQGQAFEVKEGQFIQISDMLGKQVAVCVGFNLNDFDETLSPAHTRIGNNTLMLREGHSLFSNRHNRMLTIIADSVGRHDMLVPACNPQRYIEDYGISEHPSCTDNFLRALTARKYTIEPDRLPDPINFFMNVGFKAGGELDIREPLSVRNDNILLKAHMDCLLVISACPNEQNAMNGYKPTDILVRVYQ
jgi:uncharacterized protein YcgI (DUF1989 family)